MAKRKYLTQPLAIPATTATNTLTFERPPGYNRLVGVLITTTQATVAAGAIDTGLVGLRSDTDQILDGYPALGLYSSNDVAPGEKAFILPEPAVQDQKVTTTFTYQNVVAHGSAISLNVTMIYEAQ